MPKAIVLGVLINVESSETSVFDSLINVEASKTTVLTR